MIQFPFMGESFIFQNTGTLVDFLTQYMRENPSMGIARVCTLQEAQMKRYHALSLKDDEIIAIHWALRKKNGVYPIDIVARGKEAVAKLMEQENFEDGRVLFGHGRSEQSRRSLSGETG